MDRNLSGHRHSQKSIPTSLNYFTIWVKFHQTNEKNWVIYDMGRSSGIEGVVAALPFLYSVSRRASSKLCMELERDVETFVWGGKKEDILLCNDESSRTVQSHTRKKSCERFKF